MAKTLQEILRPELIPVLMEKIVSISRPYRFVFPDSPPNYNILKAKPRRFLPYYRNDGHGKMYAVFID